jgi:ABC-type branched-subunit amino acid transport system ATPase component
MGLGPYSGRRVGALSTGMRRLTELTCVIALEPQVLLLDEPTSGLAQAEVEALVPVLEGVIRHLDLTVVMVEHDFAVAAAIGSRIVVMDSGSVAGTRTPDELRRSSGLSPTLGKPGDGKMDR